MGSLWRASGKGSKCYKEKDFKGIQCCLGVSLDNGVTVPCFQGRAVNSCGKAQSPCSWCVSTGPQTPRTSPGARGLGQHTLAGTPVRIQCYSYPKAELFLMNVLLASPQRRVPVTSQEQKGRGREAEEKGPSLGRHWKLWRTPRYIKKNRLLSYGRA